MSNVSVYLPNEVHEKYKNDTKKRKEEIMAKVRRLIADYYGLEINTSRVVAKEA